MAMTEPGRPAPAAAPPVVRLSPVAWVRRNLLSTWYNALLTVVILWVLYRAVTGFFRWATGPAQWAVVVANFRLFFIGRFPPELLWRVWLCVAALALLYGMSWAVWGRLNRTVAIGIAAGSLTLAALPLAPGSRAWVLGLGALVFAGFGCGRRFPGVRRALPWAWIAAFPLTMWLLRGQWGLAPVETSRWGGLLLTVLLAVVGVVGSFPLGLLLALGRRSTLPVVRLFSIMYIETVRGIPLIIVLFFATRVLPMFLPQHWTLDSVLRLMAGFILFTAAYLAEGVRGGLQAVPRGQMEAARALGLNGPLTLGLVVLPQALRAVIPDIVGQFISLFKDTSLVVIVGGAELLGISRSVLAQPEFAGRHREVYVFVGLLYFLFNSALSAGSRRLERALGVGER